MTRKSIGSFIPALLTTMSAAFAAALSLSDFHRNSEGVCMTHGDKAGMDVLCDWINISDDKGRINSTHKFCIGDAVRNIRYPPGGCPEGFHRVEDVEAGLCYAISPCLKSI